MRAERRDTQWLEQIEATVHASAGHARLSLDVQGLHCVGCVWLLDQLFTRQMGHESIVINPSVGRVDLVVQPNFDVRSFVTSVERFGYFFGPPIKGAAPASQDLVWRLGVCIAVAMNSMIFGIAVYAGLDRGPLFSLFTTLNLALGTVAVAVGGSVFFRSAFHALRERVLHLDLPIAIGIALAFAGSVYSYVARHSQGAYFDTLDVFIALMLVGRWLQERVVERNRAWLLASDGTDGLLARRIEGGRVRQTRCAEIVEGDLLLTAPGELLTVDARLQSQDGWFSLDWINGESSPHPYCKGDVVPAGAFAAGREAYTLSATVPFSGSRLRDLLRQPERPTQDAARASPFWQRLAKLYVFGVLLVAGVGFAGWYAATRDVARALNVTTAVLIVTCPCAFGIATPLAYELVQAGLRRRGLFVRRAGFLDRARAVKRVVFDKTGTLTTGVLVLANPAALDAMDDRSRGALYDLVARTAHPKSQAIRESLDRRPVAMSSGARVIERAGSGLELETGGRRWRLGQLSWVAPEAAPDAAYDVAFGVDGELLARFATTERLRPDAMREVDALSGDGYEVWLLSGDLKDRVDAAGRDCSLDPRRCIGGQSPEDKASFLERVDDDDTLFVGDGVNDALALDRAHVSGTPAVDRPFVPARADFFFVTPGLAPIRLALRSARVLAQVVRADLAIALAYNTLTIGLALAGRMSPLACAVLMPLSSLTTIAATVAALSPRSALWKS
jgi:Cu2+-exporting ATPase